MAIKNVKVNNVAYNEVQEVTLPLADGSGVARYVETSDANATAADIFKGMKAYVNGELIEGTSELSGDSTQDATALPEQILVGEIAYVDGAKVVGTMPNIGKAEQTLTADAPSFTIAKGYHDGTGKVQIVPENKSVTPSKAEQVVKASSGKVLDEVTVAAIPSDFVANETSDANATAADLLKGKTAYVNGVKVTGTHTDPTFTLNNGVLAIA